MNLHAQTVLLEAWTQPHRVYHNLRNHLLPLLQQIQTEPHVPTRNVLAQIAWWHDAVYEVGAGDNEERSIELMRSCIGDTDLRIDRAILATKDHMPTGDLLIDRFLRFDLGALRSGGFEELKRTEALIWEEFRSRYGAQEYVAGRMAFLQRMLTHPLIDDPSGIEQLMGHIERKYQQAIEVDIEARR